MTRTSVGGFLGLTLGVVVACASGDGRGPRRANTPEAPTGVTATPADLRVTVAWNPVTVATSYNIYWGLSSPVTRLTGNPIVGVTSPQAHMGLTNGTTYYYVVTALNAAGESAESAEVSATPNGAPLDPTFNGQGWVVHHNAAGGDSADAGYGIAVDFSGRILVTGSSWRISNHDMAIWRYNPDGTLDTSFDGRGWVIHHDAAGGRGEDKGYAIAVDSSGRILAAGYSDGGSFFEFDMVVWAYNPDGSLDTSFNGQGWVVHQDAAVSNSDDVGQAIAIDSQGRILVVGYIGGEFAGDMAIWRFNPDGTMDTSFDGKGWTVHHNAAGGNGPDAGFGIAVDPSGKIAVAGRSIGAGTSWDTATWRYNPDGTLDTSFNGLGWAVHHNAAGGDNWDEGYACAVDSSGRILVAGYSESASTGQDMASGVPPRMT